MKRMSRSCVSGGRQPSQHDMKSMTSVVSLSQGCTPNPCNHILNFILQCLPAQNQRRVQLASLIHRHYAKSLTVFNGGLTLSHGTLRQASSSMRIGIYALLMTTCCTPCRWCLPTLRKATTRSQIKFRALCTSSSSANSHPSWSVRVARVWNSSAGGHIKVCRDQSSWISSTNTRSDQRPQAAG